MPCRGPMNCSIALLLYNEWNPTPRISATRSHTGYSNIGNIFWWLRTVTKLFVSVAIYLKMLVNSNAIYSTNFFQFECELYKVYFWKVTRIGWIDFLKSFLNFCAGKPRYFFISRNCPPRKYKRQHFWNVSYQASWLTEFRWRHF